MAFNTYNGVFAEEKKLGQKIEIDCEMDYPIETMVRTDELDETVSYADVYETIAEFVALITYCASFSRHTRCLMAFAFASVNIVCRLPGFSIMSKLK